eukprot:3271622-Amphidinium_carterae.2
MQQVNCACRSAQLGMDFPPLDAIGHQQANQTRTHLKSQLKLDGESLKVYQLFHASVLGSKSDGSTYAHSSTRMPVTEAKHVGFLFRYLFIILETYEVDTCFWRLCEPRLKRPFRSQPLPESMGEAILPVCENFAKSYNFSTSLFKSVGWFQDSVLLLCESRSSGLD